MQYGALESVLFWGRYRPSTVAIIANGEECTYAQLANDVRTLTRSITRLDSDAKRVGITTSKKRDYLVQVLAVQAAGRTPVTLHTRTGFHHLNQCIVESEVQLILVDEESDVLDFAEEGKVGIPAVTLSAEDECETTDFVAPSMKPLDPWAILFSSGSTGASKAILRDQYSMVTEFIGWCLELGLTRRARFYVSRPIYYTGGMVLAMATLLVGGTVIFDDYSDDNNINEVTDGIHRATSSGRLSWLFLVPDQVRALTSEAMATFSGRIDNVLIMGAPISGSEKQSLGGLLNCNVIESWGNTESLGTITDPEYLLTCPDSVGRPFLTDELYVLDEKGNLLRSGMVGRLAGGQEAGFSEYVGREEETKQTIANGLIISEDYAYEDDQGHLFILGRAQEQLQIGSTIHFLGALEASARKCRVAQEICICPEHGDEGQVKLNCLIVPAGSEEAWQVAVEAFQAGLPAGAQLGIFKEVPQLPKTPTGKLDRTACATLLKSG